MQYQPPSALPVPVLGYVPIYCPVCNLWPKTMPGVCPVLAQPDNRCVQCVRPQVLQRLHRGGIEAMLELPGVFLTTGGGGEDDNRQRQRRRERRKHCLVRKAARGGG